MQTTMETTELRRRFFDGSLDVRELSPDEYDYYYKQLVTASNVVVMRNLLFFANKEYILVNGFCDRQYNNDRQLIKQRFYIRRLLPLSVIDKNLLSAVEEFPQEVSIQTNLLPDALMRRYLQTKTERSFYTVNKIVDLVKPYQNLLGIIQSQGAGDFFCDTLNGLSLAHLNFKKGLSEIVQTEKFMLPPIIESLVYWYSLYAH